MKDLSFVFKENDQTIVNMKVYECGEEHCSPRKLPESGMRDRYSIHFVLHGEGIIEYGEKEKKRVSLKRGHMFVIFENEDIVYYPDSQNPWSYVWCAVTGSGIDALLTDCGFTRKMPYMKIDDVDKMSNIMRELNDSYYENDNNYVCMANLLKLIDVLMRNKNWTAQGQTSQQKGKMFQKLRMYIKNNYRLPLTLEMIAGNCFVSVSYIKLLFQQLSPYSPIEYMHICRIDEACRQLYSQSDAEISQIASTVGYTDPLYFSRVFKKIVGITPSEYKNNHVLISVDIFENKKLKGGEI